MQQQAAEALVVFTRQNDVTEALKLSRRRIGAFQVTIVLATEEDVQRVAKRPSNTAAELRQKRSLSRHEPAQR